MESRLNSTEDRSSQPRIGITIGDPAGIGAEVTLKALTSKEVLSACLPIVIGDASYLSHWSRVFGLDQSFEIITAGSPIPTKPAAPVVYNLNNLQSPFEMGQESAECGRAAAAYIEAGALLCQTGQIDAITTAPINKRSLFLGGSTFPGHTEFLAHLTGCQDFAMAFFSPTLRVALLTTHVALAQVPALVEQTALERLIRLVDRELKCYGLPHPRIAVAALNPHGGEGELFGLEETSVMVPAIESCRLTDGVDVSGPYSGDTIFLRASRGEFDIVVSCYHDQGLIPIKCLSFGEAVNFTLGLPFIRTSVDHGTAFDIAGKGVADHTSMIAAIRLAAELYCQRQRSKG